MRAGLPRDIALGLAAQTVMGSAQMVLKTGKARRRVRAVRRTRWRAQGSDGVCRVASRRGGQLSRARSTRAS